MLSIDQKCVYTTPITPVSLHATIRSLSSWYCLRPPPRVEETFIFIWYDPNAKNIDSIPDIFSETKDFIRYYTDLKECLSVINSVKTNKIVLVTAVEMEQDLLSGILKLPFVDYVFIYSNNSKCAEFKQGISIYSKAFVTFNNFNAVKQLMSTTLQELNEHLETQRSFSICKSRKHVLYEFGDFLWLHVLVEAAQISHSNSTMSPNYYGRSALHRIVKAYYRDNLSMLKELDDFMKTYKPEDAILWYTSKQFLYTLLNKVLRTENFDLLLPFLFFIIDLKQCLANEHQHSPKEEVVTLYRGMNIPYEEFEMLNQAKGDLISMNGFVSTSRLRNVADMFAGPANSTPGHIAIILEIECDRFILEDKLIFVDVAKYSRYPDEKEVLIDIGAVFRIVDVREDSDGRWIINMKGSTQFSSTAKTYIQHYKKELVIKTHLTQSNYQLFVSLLSDRNRYEKAQSHLEQLLGKSNAQEIADIYVEMTRCEEPDKPHEILIRDQYDYTRDCLSGRDFKQVARTLNKIGFFLPRSENLHERSEILKVLNITENIPDKLALMESVVSAFPYINDTYRASEAMWSGASESGMIAKSPCGPHSELRKRRDQCVADGNYDKAQFYERLRTKLSENEHDNN